MRVVSEWSRKCPAGARAPSRCTLVSAGVAQGREIRKTISAHSTNKARPDDLIYSTKLNLTIQLMQIRFSPLYCLFYTRHKKHRVNLLYHISLRVHVPAVLDRTAPLPQFQAFYFYRYLSRNNHTGTSRLALKTLMLDVSFCAYYEVTLNTQKVKHRLKFPNCKYKYISPIHKSQRSFVCSL